MSKDGSRRLDRNVQRYVEWLLSHYDDMRRESVAPRVKSLTSQYVEHNELCIRAIERALENTDGIDKELIKLVYWRKSHTVAGAGQLVGLSKSAAYRRLNRIFRDIALEIGLVSL